MHTTDDEEDEVRNSPSRKTVFDRRVSLGNLMTMLTMIVSCIFAYGQITSWKSTTDLRMANIEKRLDSFDKDNLPPRVSSLESQTESLGQGLQDIHQDLISILNSLNGKADRR